MTTGSNCRESEAAWVLANRIHGSTRGLSTPTDARERIASIQRSAICGSLCGLVVPGFLVKNEVEVACETV